MAEDCGCSGGRCGSLASIELNRRDFIEKLAVGTAALAVVGQLAATVEAKEPVALTAPISAGPRPIRSRRRECIGASISKRSPCRWAASAPAACGSTDRDG